MRAWRKTGLAAVRAAILGALVAGAPALAAEEAPSRVVSMNLCTDQLAMMLAAEGQLLSVSALAGDPRSSAMAEEAGGYHANRGLAEEVYLLKPDLVLAGTYTTRATVDMLRRLGVRVETFELARSLDDVRDRIAQMGEALGREASAEALIAEFDRRRASLRSEVARRPMAALYQANGYTSGDRSLAGEILLAAGFENAASAAGFPQGGRMPLEMLAMAAPEAIVTSRPYPGASRAEDILDHPVVREMRRARGAGSFTDHDWVCGTPHVLRAIEGLAPLRDALLAGDP